jgi:hypothetical protein
MKSRALVPSTVASARIVFSATSRKEPGRTSTRARYTLLIPPSPRGRSTWYLPKRSAGEVAVVSATVTYTGLYRRRAG